MEMKGTEVEGEEMDSVDSDYTRCESKEEWSGGRLELADEFAIINCTFPFILVYTIEDTVIPREVDAFPL